MKSKSIQYGEHNWEIFIDENSLDMCVKNYIIYQIRGSNKLSILKNCFDLIRYHKHKSIVCLAQMIRLK